MRRINPTRRSKKIAKVGTTCRNQASALPNSLIRLTSILVNSKNRPQIAQVGLAPISYFQCRQPLEPLIAVGQFLIRRSGEVFDSCGNGPDDAGRPRRTGGRGSDARASRPGYSPQQPRGQAD